ncbi:MAG: hypothetical protein OEZ02_11200 [Anaerolineae bacterium]|nr:hypothetical protein [Anaerolineae bacterium]
MNADFWCLGGWGAGELVARGISRLRLDMVYFSKGPKDGQELIQTNL